MHPTKKNVVCLVTLSLFEQKDLDAPAASSPPQNSTIPYHTAV